MIRTFLVRFCDNYHLCRYCNDWQRPRGEFGVTSRNDEQKMFDEAGEAVRARRNPAAKKLTLDEMTAIAEEEFGADGEGDPQTGSQAT